MLGEMLGETQGKITGNRVLPFDEDVPKVESSFQDIGKILGVDITEIGTFWSQIRKNKIYGEGQGVIMTSEDETACWKGFGVAKFTGKGFSTSWRGSLYYKTSSKKLERLNNTVVVFEYEIDDTGNTDAKIWEWK
jgi:hypothetical protein